MARYVLLVTLFLASLSPFVHSLASFAAKDIECKHYDQVVDEDDCMKAARKLKFTKADTKKDGSCLLSMAAPYQTTTEVIKQCITAIYKKCNGPGVFKETTFNDGFPRFEIKPPS